MLKNIILILILLANSLYAQHDHELQQYLNKLEKDPDLKNAAISFYAIHLSNGKVIASLNEEKSLIPASVTKVFSTASALSILGKDKTFKTLLEYDGSIDSNGVLHGNIYIKGGGDPSLGSPLFNKDNPLEFIQNWVSIIKNKFAIKEIKGTVIADVSIFDNNIPGGWAWGDIGNYYGAGTHALSIYDNTYELEFDTRNPQNPILKNIYPKLPEYVLINELEASTKQADNSIIYGYPDTDERIIKGSIPAGKTAFKVKGATPSPDKLVVWLMKEELKKQNILFTNDTFKVNEKDRKLIHEHSSPTLAEIIYQTNLKSINSYAECLLNQIALTKYTQGSTSAGLEVMYQFLKNNQLNTDGLYITDGSGLSRSNAIAAIHLVQILQLMYNDKNNFEVFKKSLPVAGKSGSVANICKGTSAEGRVFAKSGYMTRVRSYAGYVSTLKGEEIAFAVIVNNYNCSPAEMKAKLEKLFIALAEHH